MINQQRVIVNSGDTNGQFHHNPVSAKPSVVSVSSIDSDVSDRRDVREALYSGIFRRHRKTILVLGSFLKMLRKNLNKVQALSRILAMIVMRFEQNSMFQPFY
ncbi:uncharacterized protein LOC107037536 [Diachasma alloeum]|uniref:uncharacterized protein LOC107037536 n=1 Tax=Diachasma alloeum TaxID=454923 RepID=UPI0007384FC3|nr:uncharacterized protein LOC107037536 [Diachasma alloeum]XP_015111627.1 uncharacterized protein LOC107037536 [Diachasma alloeum]XP_015111628.1 uncharacterized protein LOC107037536 [Diachasma alloeum]XP_015111629.1 uncharacterized protein LOC107037536 [Diachasma alloeum]